MTEDRELDSGEANGGAALAAPLFASPQPSSRSVMPVGGDTVGWHDGEGTGSSQNTKCGLYVRPLAGPESTRAWIPCWPAGALVIHTSLEVIRRPPIEEIPALRPKESGLDVSQDQLHGRRAKLIGNTRMLPHMQHSSRDTCGTLPCSTVVQVVATNVEASAARCSA